MAISELAVLAVARWPPRLRVEVVRVGTREVYSSEYGSFVGLRRLNGRDFDGYQQ